MRYGHGCKRIAFALATVALAACDRSTSGPTRVSPEAPAGNRLLQVDGAIPDRYVVVLNQDRTTSAAATAREVVGLHGGKVHFTYQNAISGFAATLTPEGVEALLRNPHVAYVSPDAMLEPSWTQASPPWGLDRIDQRYLPLDSAYTYTPTGFGVTVYVIDSGIRTSHSEFGGRASVGTDFVPDGQNGQDCSGHGTHVAGTIGGATYGVAKAVSLVAVRVLPCSGGTPLSTVIAAVDWVTANRVNPAVANISLNGGTYPPLDDAVTASVASGVTYVVSAGNSNNDACVSSPARAPAAITVAASNASDNRAAFSNWGSCVDLFAPGTGITSAWFDGDSATAIQNGTTMAAPHVTGVAAHYLQMHPSASPASVDSAITASATGGRIPNPSGSPNLLLFSRLTPEVLRLDSSALSFDFYETAGPAAAGAGAEGAPVWRSSGDASTKRLTTSPAARVSPSAVGGAVVPLINTSGAPVAWSSASSAWWLSISPTSGTVDPLGVDSLAVSVNSSMMSPGTYTGTITVTGGGATLSVDVTMRIYAISLLTSGVPVTGLSAASGELKFYRIEAPLYADSLVFTLAGPNGDADLYVKRGSLPSTTGYDCRSVGSTSVERCTTAAPTVDTYYVLIHAWTGYTGLEVQATAYGVFTPPTAASGVSANGAGAGKVNVLWADNSDNETFFRVRRATRNPDGTFGAYGTLGNRGPNNTSMLDSTVMVGSTYRYQVQTCNDRGCTYSAPSGAITVVLPPGAPTGLAALIGGIETINLSWSDNSSNESYFRVRRSKRNPDGTYPAYTALHTTAANTTTHSDTTVEKGSTYRYQVQACNGGGCGTSAAATITIPLPPGAPSGLTGSAFSSSQINLAWTDGATNETSFRIRRAKRNPDGTFGSYLLVTTVGSNTTTYFDTSVSAASTYRYYVQACNGGGCTSSGISSTVTTPAS